MSKKIVRVMAAFLSGTAGKVTLRVRWVLATEGAAGASGAAVDLVGFPHADDHFLVTLTNENSAVAVPRQVFPRPYVMLDPPRKLTPLSTSGEGTLQDWLARPFNEWRPVDPHDPVLVPPEAPDTSKALGVGHLLRYSHPDEVDTQVHALAHATLVGLRAEGQPNFAAMSDADLHTHAAVFTAILRRAPFHPAELFGNLRAILTQAPLAGQPAFRADLPAWLIDALASPDGGILTAGPTGMARLATSLHLFLEPDLRMQATTLAQEAESMRSLMALRASQAGTVLDYWCDFDKTSADTASSACDRSLQGRVCLVAEAFGLGTDFEIPLADAGARWRIDVEHVQAPSLPGPGYETGHWTLPRSAGLALQKGAPSSHALPAAASFTASIDYQLVSSYHLPAGGSVERQLNDLMALAKPVTGDGQVTIAIARSPSAAEAQFVDDYPYNVYCIWDGETSGAVQQYIDDPWLAPSLDELRPFLVTRRYSYRRDLAEGLSEARIAELALLTRPPHEAAIGLPDAILQDGVEYPYPSRSDGQGQARISFNLRDILPSENDAATGVKWERGGGGRPDLYTQDKLWTVERARPGTVALPASQLPQRYRIWVTAVDIFEQETAPIAVLAAEPGAADSPFAVADTIFVPRWRSPPPPATDVVITCTAPAQKLHVSWAASQQRPVGTAIAIARPSLQAEVALMRRPIREVVKSTLPTLALGGNDGNPVLQRAIAELESEGWTLWRRQTVDAPANGDKWSAEWTLGQADRGYEYRALIARAVPPPERRFLHDDSVQIVRYLVRSISGTGFQEAYWQIPQAGADAHFRNYPAFSPVARSDAAMAMPQAGELPALASRFTTQDLARVRPVLGVHGILRDVALAKLLALRDSPSVAPQRPLSTAETFMMETALTRLKESGLGERALKMAATLLGNEFVAADASGARRDTQHPIIGLRGAVHLAWPDAAPSATHVPTVLYRIYAARGAPTAAAHARVRCTGPGSFTVVSESAPNPLAQPAMMIIDRRMQWRGLVVRDGTALTVHGVSGGPAAVGAPQDKVEYDCWFFEGRVAAEVPPVLEAGQHEFEAALPVPGGHSETGIWWLATVNCANQEAWLRDDDGSAVMFARYLPETITPAAPVRLQARAPVHFDTEALQAGDYDRYRALKVIPDQLERDGGSIFPRTILSWDPAEFSAAETYLLFERQHEADDATLALSSTEDPSWGLLKAIESGAAGAPWDAAYSVLRPWLEGGNSPRPPAGYEPLQRAYFFSTRTPGDHAAWAMKDASMLPATDLPWPETRSYADYFASPPSEDDRSTLTRGERRVRYRAYKMVDLLPGTAPDPAAFDSRYLVSEPSAWTGWAQADWPPVSVDVTTAAVPRAGNSLIRFSVTCDLKTGALARTALGTDGDGSLLFRLEIYRTLETAFGQTPTTMRVGELLEIAVPHGNRPAPVLAADYSVERDSPGAATTARYGCTAALVRRRRVDGRQAETVLRMADRPQPFDVTVASGGTAESAMLVNLRILIG